MAAPSPRDFMARVVAWPGPDEPGYVNLHYLPPRKPGDTKPGMRGRAFKSLDNFMGMAAWCATHPGAVAHTYFCLSTQSATGKEIHGHKLAHRTAKTALKLKSIWLDIDVKPGAAYATLSEALAGVSAFLDAAKLPPPSALVVSGSGLHVYWISDRPLTVAEWRPYAEGLKLEAIRCGLKCDAGLTTDEARVLRVPGTTNGKTTLPKPVVLKHLGQDYEFQTVLARLGQIGTTSANVTAAVTPPAGVQPYDLTNFTAPSAAFAKAGLVAGRDSLAAGIRDDRPLDPDAVFENCPHFQDAALTHGVGYPQGLWMLDVLACTFFENGRRWAHYLSKGYGAYDRAETDAMYDRKEADKQRGIGWPSCQAFEDHGCKSCATCPFRGKIKSPLNLANRSSPSEPAGGTANDKAITPPVALMELSQQGADLDTALQAMNQTYAVTKHGSQVVVASIIGQNVELMRPADFHLMFANLDIVKETDGKKQRVKLSRCWFTWDGRRQYCGRGIVFEPGGPQETPDDMLNLWRGYGIEPKPGDWSRMRNHLLNVICSGRQELYDYLIKWMAYAVQHPNEPIGVAVALRGAQGAGKGVVARTLGKIFGRHFAHIANGEQLTGRFNASLATSCAVFLDEALWAGDRKGEGVLKALITEPRLQLEAKFRDPIMVDNRLRIMVASNEDWCVPAGIGDRRWFVLDVADTYAGMAHGEYWNALYAEINNGGTEAMFHDLLKIDLSSFDVRAVPHTAAKAQQQAHSLQGANAWLYQVLQDGVLGPEHWNVNGLTISTETAYTCYKDFSKQHRQFRPDGKAEWSKKLRKVLGTCLGGRRPAKGKDQRDREFKFAPLAECRCRFAAHIGAPGIEWEADEAPQRAPEPARQTSDDVGHETERDTIAPSVTIATTPDMRALQTATAVGAADLAQSGRMT